MKFIAQSAEHHFLTFLERVKRDPGGWHGLRFAMSQKTDHKDMISNPAQIRGKLAKISKDSEAIAADIQDAMKDDDHAILYKFENNDLILLARANTKEDQDNLQKLFTATAEKAGKKLSSLTNLVKDLYSYQKLADKQLLAAHLITAYKAMGDENRVHSIPLRRERRDDPTVMMVEDDRFTASYAANILNKEYDMIVAKTGEEAIGLYVEHAPDIVFLDIHLPGLDGHDTLRAIRKLDPRAFIIMLSVDTVKENIVTANKEGAFGFLKKPFSKERLIAAVEKSPYVKRHKRRI